MGKMKSKALLVAALMILGVLSPLIPVKMVGATPQTYAVDIEGGRYIARNGGGSVVANSTDFGAMFNTVDALLTIGDTVNIQAGTYLASTVAAITKSGVTVTSSVSATVKAASTTTPTNYLFEDSGSDTTISGITFDGFNNTIISPVVKIMGDNNTVDGCSFLNGFQYGLEAYCATNFHFLNNYCMTNQNGIATGGTPYNFCSGVIEYNDIHDSRQAGIKLRWINGVTVRNNTIDTGYVYWWNFYPGGPVTSAGGEGIYLAYSDGPVVNALVYNNTIVDSTTHAKWSIGLIVTSETDAWWLGDTPIRSSGNVFTSNSVADCYYGAMLNGTATVAYSIIADSGTYGVWVQSGADGCHILSDTISGSGVADIRDDGTGTVYSSPPPSTVFSTDFEDGLGKWNGTGTSDTLSTLYSVSPTHSALLNSSVPSDWLNTTFTAINQPTIWLNCSIKTPSPNTIGFMDLYSRTTWSSDVGWGIIGSTFYIITAYNGTSSTYDTFYASVVANSTYWSRISLKITEATDATGAYDLYCNGTSILSVTGVQTIFNGEYYDTLLFYSAATDIYLDDVSISTTSPAPDYTLTILAPSGSGTTNVTTGAHVYTNGTIVSVDATASGSYTFSHWVLDGSPAGSSNPVAVTMTGDHTLQAVFTLATWTLTMQSPTGSGSVSPTTGAHTYANGSAVTITATPASGWTFKNWIIDGTNSTINPASLTMLTNHTLKAIFQQGEVGLEGAYTSWKYVSNNTILFTTDPTIQAIWLDNEGTAYIMFSGWYTVGGTHYNMAEIKNGVVTYLTEYEAVYDNYNINQIFMSFYGRYMTTIVLPLERDLNIYRDGSVISSIHPGTDDPFFDSAVLCYIWRSAISPDGKYIAMSCYGHFILYEGVGKDALGFSVAGMSGPVFTGPSGAMSTYTVNLRRWENGTKITAPYTAVIINTNGTINNLYVPGDGVLYYGNIYAFTYPLMVNGTQRTIFSPASPITPLVPNNPTGTYIMEVRDPTNYLVGKQCYLVASKPVNGTEMVISSSPITGRNHQGYFDLEFNQLIHFTLEYNGASVYDFGFFLPTTANVGKNYLDMWLFSKTGGLYHIGQIIVVDAYWSGSNIVALYGELMAGTISMNITITDRNNGTTLFNGSAAANATWTIGADPTHSYTVSMAGTHALVQGTWTYVKVLDASGIAYPALPPMAFWTFGGVSLTSLFALAIDSFFLMMFSYRWRAVGMLAAMSVASITWVIGWAPWMTWPLIALGWAWSVGWAITIMEDER